MTERREWRVKRFAPAAICLAFVAMLCIPWTASVGSYGTLVAIPGREAIVRAPENGSLIVVSVQPGQRLTEGSAIGRMGNLDVEEQIAQVRTELACVNADADRLAGELRVQDEAAAASKWQLAQKRRELAEVEAEEHQIRTALPIADSEPGSPARFIVVSMPASTAQLPAALAAMQANAEQLQARLAEVGRERERARILYAERIGARSDLDFIEAKWSALAFDLAAARERLNAAFIEHRRRLESEQTEVNVADANLSVGRAQINSLGMQSAAAARLRESLEDRLILLQRKRAQFVLAALVGGTVFGEDLSRMAGQFFPKGAEICRIADTGELLVRAQFPEQSIEDVAPGNSVRVKTRAFPDRVFGGVVTRIGSESELNQNGQRCYRVELTICNRDGLLRPGMTVFARVTFGRHVVAWLAVHKLKQALRPETWML